MKMRHCSAGRLPVAVLASALCLRAAHAGLVEDFSTMANGSTDSNGNGVLDLGDTGAVRTPWDSQTIKQWRLEVDGSSALSGNPYGSDRLWMTMGRPHNVSLAGGVRLDLTAKVRGKGMQNPSDANYFISRYLWLANSSQNGYGVVFTSWRYQNATQNVRNGFDVLKMYNGTNPFGSWGPVEQSNASGGHWEHWYSEAGWQQYSTSDWFTLHVALEQSGAGQPVKITIWATGVGNGSQDTSYASPLLTLTDDGDGTPFTSTTIYNLTALTHFGTTIKQSWMNGSDTLYNLIDDIDITVTRPPPKGTVVLVH